MGYEPIMLPLHQLAIYFGCGPETRTRNYGLWAHCVTITPTRDLFELPPRVELGTTDYKSVILPAKLQKHLSYIVQAFYFQFRELVSNLTLLTTVRVPEDITFVLGRGVEPLLPGWKPEVLTDRRTEQFFYYQHVKELFCSVVIFNNNTKLIHFFDTDKYKQKKTHPFEMGFCKIFFIILSHLHFGSISLCCWCAEYEYGFHRMYYYLISY